MVRGLEVELRKVVEERDALVRLFVEWWINDDCDNSYYFNQIMKFSPSVVTALDKS